MPSAAVFTELGSAGMLMLAYSKDPMELETRRQVYEYVDTYPGAHLSQIARGVELDPNHVKYHLRYLEKHDLVSSLRQGGHLRFYPRTNGAAGKRDVFGVREKRILSALRRAVPLQVIMFLLDKGEATHGEIVEAVDVSSSTAHYHLKKLEESEVLTSRREGRCRYYELAEPEITRRLLADFEPPDEVVKGFLEAWEDFEL